MIVDGYRHGMDTAPGDAPALTPPPATDGLARRIRKKHPFSCPEQEAYLNLVLAREVLGEAWLRLFKSQDLSESTYNVLRILRGEHPEGVPVLEIRRRMVNRVPDVTRLVDRLEEMKLVKRVRCERDRRVIYCHITAAGLERLTALDRATLDLHKTQLGHLTEVELRTLSDLLSKAREPNDPEASAET